MHKEEDKEERQEIQEEKKRGSTEFISKSKVLLHKLKNVYIEPENSFRMTYNVLVVLAFLYNALSVTYRAFFEQYTIWYLFVLDIIADLVFLLNIPLVLLGTTDLNTIRYRSRKKALRRNIVRILYDIVSIVPVDYFLVHPAWRANRLLQVWRGFSYYTKVEQSITFVNPIILRILKYVMALVLVDHIFACIWFWSGTQYHEAGNWVFTENPGPLILNVLQDPPGDWSYSFVRLRQYLAGLYFSTIFLVGYASMQPQDWLQVVYALGTALVGLGFFATIVGTVSALINSIDQTASRFKQKMDNINSYMKFRKISKELQRDVKFFYTTLQRSKMGLDQAHLDHLLGDLELSIQRDLSKYLHRDLVKKVELFKNMGDLFIDDVCVHLKYTLLLKDYYIIRAGEVGREMFFIGRGTVDVVTESGVFITSIARGGYFGEGALLSGQRRGANIIAKEMCELYVLHKADFDNIMNKHPDARKVLDDVRREREEEATQKANDQSARKVDTLMRGGKRRRRLRKKKKAISSRAQSFFRRPSTAGLKGRSPNVPKLDLSRDRLQRKESIASVKAEESEITPASSSPDSTNQVKMYERKSETASQNDGSESEAPLHSEHEVVTASAPASEKGVDKQKVDGEDDNDDQ